MYIFFDICLSPICVLATSYTMLNIFASRNHPGAFEEEMSCRDLVRIAVGLPYHCRTIAEEMFDVRCMMFFYCQFVSLLSPITLLAVSLPGVARCDERSMMFNDLQF